MALPLAGIRVLDLTRVVAGPTCTMILADLGADVVKFEKTPEGDMSRAWGPFVGGVSTFFMSVNRNKRSVALDLRDPRAIELLRDLADGADVVVENFKPGTMEAMGLGWETLRARNPGLVYAGISGFGRDGPYGGWPGLDQIAQGMSGLMSITGQAESGPTRVGIPIGDLVAGMWAAIGVQAALLQRVSTGHGQRVEASLLAGLVGLLCVQGQRHLSLGEVPGVAGNDHPVIAPYGVFQASDGPFNMAAVTEENWRTLCRLLGAEELLAVPDFRDNASRVAHRAELRTRLDAMFASRTRAEWTSDLIALGLPAGGILDMAGVFEDPQVRHCRMAEEVDHPTLGSIRLLASPVEMDALGGRSVRRPPPLLGEHGVEALREWGVTGERLSALIQGGVVAPGGSAPAPARPDPACAQAHADQGTDAP